jgi:hypothetical protein
VTSTSSTSRPARRTLVKGAAWSVPAIAVATQAHAQTGSPPIIVEPQGGAACKFPGASCSPYKQAYRFVFCFTNQSAENITVTFPLIELPQGTNTTPIPGSVNVPAGAVNLCFYIIADEQGSSANGQGTLFYEYSVGGEDFAGSVGTGANELPPCDDCSDQFGVAGDAVVSEQTLTEESTEPSGDEQVTTDGATTEDTSTSEVTSQDATTDEGSTTDATTDTAESTAGTDR